MLYDSNPGPLVFETKGHTREVPATYLPYTKKWTYIFAVADCAATCKSCAS